MQVVQVQVQDQVQENQEKDHTLFTFTFTFTYTFHLHPGQANPLRGPGPSLWGRLPAKPKEARVHDPDRPAAASTTAATPALPAEIEAAALDLLVQLVRIPTWQPDHVERPAAELLADWLASDGLEPRLIEAAPGRSNLVVRYAGTGERPPLLLAGHLDTVPPGPAERWSHPPLAAEVHGGFLYGRGVLDMKGTVAAFATVLRALAREKRKLRRDVILAAVADEETGCAQGSRLLVERHPALVRAEYGLGEVGGFTQWIGGLPVYPVQVAEKGTARLRMTARGEAGHASLPRPDSAPVRLGEAIARLGRTRLPLHPTRTVALFLARLAAALPPPRRWALPRLLHPLLGGVILDRLIADPALRRNLGAMVANTITPTILRGGEAVNQVPGEASCDMDGRLLPGQSAADLIREVQQVIGPRLELTLLDSEAGTEGSAETALFGIIEEELRAAHPGAVVVPNLIPAYTDGRYFSRLGTTWYGFSPLRMPLEPGPSFASLIHGFDERLPLDGFRWGLHVLYRVVCRA